jgi:hypothetical protein
VPCRVYEEKKEGGKGHGHDCKDVQEALNEDDDKIEVFVGAT